MKSGWQRVKNCRGSALYLFVAKGQYEAHLFTEGAGVVAAWGKAAADTLVLADPPYESNSVLSRAHYAHSARLRRIHSGVP